MELNMSVLNKANSVAAIATGIEIGNLVINTLVGDVLDGTHVQEAKEAFAIALSNELQKKGETK